MESQIAMLSRKEQGAQEGSIWESETSQWNLKGKAEWYEGILELEEAVLGWEQHHLQRGKSQS